MCYNVIISEPVHDDLMDVVYIGIVCFFQQSVQGVLVPASLKVSSNNTLSSDQIGSHRNLKPMISVKEVISSKIFKQKRFPRNNI